jgi:hypothetical protein
MTIKLLTIPPKTARRQKLHAYNFNSLPPAARPMYLHVVAYAIGCTVTSNWQSLDSKGLEEHLMRISSIYDVPMVSPEESQRLMKCLPVVQATLKKLNLLIFKQVASDPRWQQSMYAGAVIGIVTHSGDSADVLQIVSADAKAVAGVTSGARSSRAAKTPAQTHASGVVTGRWMFAVGITLTVFIHLSNSEEPKPIRPPRGAIAVGGDYGPVLKEELLGRQSCRATGTSNAKFSWIFGKDGFEIRGDGSPIPRGVLTTVSALEFRPM